MLILTLALSLWQIYDRANAEEQTIYDKQLITKENLNSKLREAAVEGSEWLNSADPSDNVYTLVTFPQRKSVKDALNFSHSNNLKVIGWSHMMDAGNITMTGGYFVAENETLEEAEKRYFERMKINIQKQIELLGSTETNTDLPQKARQAAADKKEELKNFLSKLTSEKPIVYGMKVKGKVSEIRKIMNSKEVIFL